jgi:WD40 repeat protein
MTQVKSEQHPWIYDAFLSYSHASDAQTVRELRASIERFGRPFLRARSFLVWHDRASLSMTDALWHEIASALDQSRNLLVILSPDAAKSPWVHREVKHFLIEKPRARVGLILSQGRTPWTDGEDVLDAADCAVSKNLFELFSADGDQPNVIDLRPYRAANGTLRKKSAAYEELIASIAASISGRRKDELYGAHLRSLRRRLAVLIGMVVLLAVLAGLAYWSALRATRQKQIERAGRATALAARPGREREALQAAIPPAAWALAQHWGAPAQTTEGIVAAIDAELRSRELSGHSGDVMEGLFAPDGGTVVTASSDGTAKVWTGDGRLRSTLPKADAPLDAAAFAHDGQLVATATTEGSITIWETDGWSARSSFSCDCRRPRSMTFSPDDSELLVACESGQTTSWGLDGVAGRIHLKGHYADYSPDGTRIATAVTPQHGGDTVVVWESQTRLHERTFDDVVHSVAFHPTQDGVLLVAWDRYAGIWDTRTNGLQTFSHPERVERARFSPDGARIVTASSDGTRLWDTDGTMRDLLIAHRRYMISAMFSPDGERVLTTGGDGSARIWSPRATQALRRFGQKGPRIRWAGADAGALVSLDVDGAIRLLAKGTDAPRLLIARAVGVTLDPRRNRVVAVDRDGEVSTYESTSGRQLALAPGDGRSLWRARFSPDRARYIGVRSDGTAFLGQTDAGSPPKEVGDGALSKIRDALFCGDGTRIVTESSDGAVALLDGVSGRVDAKFPGCKSAPVAVDCTQDGARVFAACSDGRTFLWSGTSAKIVATLAVGAPAKAAAFSPDGQQLVVGDIDGDLLVFGARTGACIDVLSPHAKSVTHLAYAANGDRFLSSSEDGTVRVWEEGSHELMATLRVAEQDALYADFTREDGEELIVGDGGGGSSLFSIAPRSLISRGCDLLRGTPAFGLVRDDCARVAK